jgi:hypothetical protein
LHRCPVCKAHAECPVRVGWRLGPIVLCGYFHVNGQGDVEAIHITSLYKPVQQVKFKHAFTQTDAVVVIPSDDDEDNADLAPGVWTRASSVWTS